MKVELYLAAFSYNIGCTRLLYMAVVFIFVCFCSPTNMGLLDPATSDGRIIFFLPWEGETAEFFLFISSSPPLPSTQFQFCKL